MRYSNELETRNNNANATTASKRPTWRGVFIGDLSTPSAASISDHDTIEGEEHSNHRNANRNGSFITI
jgi:hypothetical protein